MALFNWKKKTAVSNENNKSISAKPEHELQPVKVDTIRNIEDKEFDLNIEKILENWEVYHAIREIIANALDEQILMDTQDIQIIKKNNEWHIIDFGRGINYHHLTQNENEEKLNNDKLIGRFGVGLKDALATLYRHKIGIIIISKYGIITLMEASKTGFDDIITLHAKIEDSPNKNMIGTDFALIGCEDIDIEIAKSLFLTFTNSRVLEKTNYGQVISKEGDASYIYINGVKVSEENNFLFSYNITSLTKQIKKALNRERTNVGRTAYSERIKSILLACKEECVICNLVDDLQQYNTGLRHDELSWNDVAMYASRKIGDFKKNVVFVTSDTAISTPSVIDDMKMKGFEPIVVPETLVNKLDDYNQGTEENSAPILTTNKFISDMAEKKKYTFVEETKLSPLERDVYSKMDVILKLIGGKPNNVKQIKVSETIYESEIFAETVGLWDSSEGIVIIKRCQLKSLQSFAGTLIHECIHAKSGEDDVNRGFERALTDIIGVIVAKQFYN
jgi:hypothetical protein